MTSGNLYENADVPATGERFDVLLQRGNLVVERIISSKKITPAEYVQEQDEWVVLISGTATLEIAGKANELKAGDYVFLPTKTPHTVQRVSEGAMWLALHLHPVAPS